MDSLILLSTLTSKTTASQIFLNTSQSHHSYDSRAPMIYFPQRKIQSSTWHLRSFTILHLFMFLYLFSHTFFTAAPATLNSLLFIDHLGILHFPLLDCSPPIYFRDCLHLDLCSLKSLHII